MLAAALLFSSAGRLDWMMGWTFIGSLAECIVTNALILFHVNPEVLPVRLEGSTGAKPWDIVIVWVTGSLQLGSWLVAGLDTRFGWSEAISEVWNIAALMAVAAGNFVTLWAMSVNKFCARFVRVQAERGHHVIDTGPYRYVRHPGYVGWMLYCGATPIALGSWWALIPAVAAIGGVVLRTMLEDKMLRAELPNYKEYASRVRFRLLPGVR